MTVEIRIDLGSYARPPAGAITRGLARALGLRADDVRAVRPGPFGLYVSLARAPHAALLAPVALELPLGDGRSVQVRAELADAPPLPPGTTTELLLLPAGGAPSRFLPLAGAVARGVALALGLGPEDVGAIRPHFDGLAVRIPATRLAHREWPVEVHIEGMTEPWSLAPTSPSMSPRALLEAALALSNRAGEDAALDVAERLRALADELAPPSPDAASAEKKTSALDDVSCRGRAPFPPLFATVPAPDAGELERCRRLPEPAIRAWWRGLSAVATGLVDLWAAAEHLGRWAQAREHAPAWVTAAAAMVSEAAAAWLSAAGPTATRAACTPAQVHGAWRACGFAAQTEPLPPWLGLAPSLVREAAASVAPEERRRMARRLERIVDPRGQSEGVVGALRRAQQDEELSRAGAPAGGPADPRVLALREAGASDVWSAAGGRLAARAGAVLRRYPALVPWVPCQHLASGATEEPSVDAAFFLVEAGRREEAEAAIARVERALHAGGAPPFWHGLLLRAELAVAAGEDGKARQWLGRAIEAAPRRPEPYALLAQIERFAGRYAAALAALERAPNTELIGNLRGLTLYRLGRRDEARRFGHAPVRVQAERASPDWSWERHRGALLPGGLLDGDRASRAEALLAAGDPRGAVAALWQEYRSQEPSEALVLRLAELECASVEPMTPPAALAELADRAGAAAGTVLPGAEGLGAAQAARWVQTLWARAGRTDEAKRARAIRREVLDRSLERGHGGGPLLAELLDWAAGTIEDSGVEPWQDRVAIALGVWDDAPWHPEATAAAVALAVALGGPGGDGSAEAAWRRALDDRSPETADELETWPEAAQRAVWQWHVAMRGAAEVAEDPRFAHAVLRRLVVAEALAQQGRADDAIAIAAALLRRRVAGGERERAALLLVAQAPHASSTLAGDALERELALPSGAAAIAAVVPALCAWDDARVVSGVRARVPAWLQVAELTVQQAHALARLAGHAAATEAAASQAWAPRLELPSLQHPFLFEAMREQARCTLARLARMDLWDFTEAGSDQRP